MIGISHIPGCHGSLVAMATRVKPQKILCLSHIEFIFHSKVL